MKRTPYASLDVPLPADVREQTYLAVIEDCRRTVQANSDRDQELWMLRLQLEGVAQPGSTNPNGCQLEDPLCRELHTSVLASILSAFRQKPYCTFEALQPDDDTRVSRLETLSNTEVQLFGFDQALATLVYIALEGKFCVATVDYATSHSKRKELRDAELPDGEETKEELWNVNEVTEQFEFRPIEQWDFYLSPVGSQRVDDCDRVYERVWMSRTALLDGVRNKGFDKDAVRELLAGGPTAVQQGFAIRAEQMLLNGVSEDIPGFYECFHALGRMPRVLDTMGEEMVPEQFLDEDYEWWFCPERQIVFKHTYRRHPVRNFATGKALGRQDELMGHGVVSSVAAIADELTIFMRSIIDGLNYSMDPTIMVPEGQVGWYSQHWRAGQGKFAPYRGVDRNAVGPLVHDFQGLQMAATEAANLYARAQRMVAAEGVNSIGSGKVRRAAEVEFQQQVLQSKFGLMLNNLQRMVEDIFRIYLAMRKHTLPEGHSVRQGNSQQEIKREDFDVAFRIIPHADADNASSTARLARDKTVYDLLHNSPWFQQRIAMGDMDGEYMLLSTMLSHMGYTNPAVLLGPPPEGFDPTAVLRRILPIVAQGAQQGDPVATAIIQAVQQGKQQAVQGGVQPQSGVTAGSGMALPAMPASDSSAQGAMSSNGATVNV